MARPTKHYSRELSLILLMQPGDSFTFPSKHPRGLGTKIYEFLKRTENTMYKLTIHGDSVTVKCDNQPVLVTPEVYKAYGL